MKPTSLLLCWLGLAAVAFAAEKPKPPNPDAALFESKVLPVLSAKCLTCHGDKLQQSDLRLDSREALLKGGKRGAVVIAGEPEKSSLIKAIRYDGELKMPPTGKLADEDIAALTAWVKVGAPWSKPRDPRDHWSFRPIQEPATPAVKNKAWVKNPIDAFILAELEKRNVKPSPPADKVTLIRRVTFDLIGLPPTPEEVKAFLADNAPNAYEKVVDRLLASPHYGERWGRHWLDVARYADSNGFNIDAARQIWKWRDWVIDALNKDMPFDQFTMEQIAGDVLWSMSQRVNGSTNGSTSQRVNGSTDEPNIDPLTHLPIDSLGLLTATGFHRNTLINQEGGIDVEQFRVESVVDRVNTTGAVFLGLTIGCAQCHDHKYDPISQREFYRLFAFFNNCDEPDFEFATSEEKTKRDAIRQRIDAMTKDIAQLAEGRAAEWEKSLTADAKQKLKPEVRVILDISPDKRSDSQKKLLLDAFKAQDAVIKEREVALAELKKTEPQFVKTMVVQERAAPRETHVHVQGDFTRKGERVFAGVPSVLPALSVEQPTRLDLAKWLVDPKHPLTARVTVNRVWQQYFGRGLVETENDFGVKGTPPTHPKLLDWLATTFMSTGQLVNQSISKSTDQLTNLPMDSYGCGWSLKRLHRLIVTSATYRQSSKARPDLNAIDPQNKWLARQARLRLDAEIIRDAALATSGLLSRKIGGPSVFPPQPEGVYRFTQIDKQWKASEGEDRYRRGMYTHFWRSAPYPFLMTFDAPNSTTTCTRRVRSNTPLQALTLLNDEAFFEFAQGLAARALKESPSFDFDRIRYAFRLCLAREPNWTERERLRKLLILQRESFAAAPDDANAIAPKNLPQGCNAIEAAAWTMVARALLNLDEFMTRE